MISIGIGLNEQVYSLHNINLFISYIGDVGLPFDLDSRFPN